MGFSSNWRKITKAFEQEYQILVYDQRGHGRSFQPNSGYRPEDFAADLEKILDELNWPEITLVGHSLGGRNAIQFTSDNMRRVNKLVVEDIGPEADRSNIDRIRSLINGVPAPFANRDQAKDFFEKEFPKKFADRQNPQALAQYLFANLKSLDSGKMDWRFSKKGIFDSLEAGRAQDRWKEWESLDLPILLLRGERSLELSPEIFEEMLNRNPKAKGQVIKEAGHWIHSEQSEAFIRALSDFFSE